MLAIRERSTQWFDTCVASNEWTESAMREKDAKRSEDEERIDDASRASFPASDPPSWWQGVEPEEPHRPEGTSGPEGVTPRKP